MYVDYSVPIDNLRKQLVTVLDQSTNWNKKLGILQVTEFKEHAIELRILLSANDAVMLWDLRCEVREKMLNYLHEHYPNSLPRLVIKPMN